MKNKKKIDVMVRSFYFPTPKNVIWKLKQDGILLSEEEKAYVWSVTQIVLEETMMKTTNTAQIGSIQKYLSRNFEDWNENKNSNSKDAVNITISTNNDSENKF